MNARQFPRVVVFPYYVDNPFTDLLYRSVQAVGYEIRGPRKFEAFELETAELAAGDVLHIQWTSPIAHVGRDEPDAWRRVERFQRAVRAARRRGVTLVWTVHNRLPHDSRFLEPELALIRFIVEHAAAVHVMNRATAEAVADLYDLPASKTVVVPHSSYLGVYPQSMGRAEARAAFQLGDDETAVLFFGQMRPYKGLDRLFDAVSRLSASGQNLALLLAGRVNPADAAAIESSIPRNVRVIRSEGEVDGEDVQRWFGAADVTVLPYRQVLNSGTALLSATFGVPVLLPDLPHLRQEFGDQPWVHVFPAAEPDGLERSLAAFADSPTERDAARRFARDHAPERMAESFARLLETARRETLDGSTAAGFRTRRAGRSASAVTTMSALVRRPGRRPSATAGDATRSPADRPSAT